jgi:hypothetical protein
MNFYSEDIINNIIDNSELENIIEKIDEFNNNILYLLYKYSDHKVYYKYIQNLRIILRFS